VVQADLHVVACSVVLSNKRGITNLGFGLVTMSSLCVACWSLVSIICMVTQLYDTSFLNIGIIHLISER